MQNSQSWGELLVQLKASVIFQLASDKMLADYKREWHNYGTKYAVEGKIPPLRIHDGKVNEIQNKGKCKSK